MQHYKDAVKNKPEAYKCLIRALDQIAKHRITHEDLQSASTTLSLNQTICQITKEGKQRTIISSLEKDVTGEVLNTLVLVKHASK